MSRTGGRVRKFHEDLFNLQWTRVYCGLQLNAGLTPKGRPIESVTEWIISRRSAPDSPNKTVTDTYIDVKSINGKAPKRKELDPFNYSHPFQVFHPIELLSTEKQAECDFSWEGETDLRGSKTVVITATPAVVTEQAIKIEGRSFTSNAYR